VLLTEPVTTTSASEAPVVCDRSQMNRSYRIVPIGLMVSAASLALSQIDGFVAGGKTSSKVLVVVAIVMFVWAAVALARAERNAGRGEKRE
jgi:hypothetical protein